MNDNEFRDLDERLRKAQHYRIEIECIEHDLAALGSERSELAQNIAAAVKVMRCSGRDTIIPAIRAALELHRTNMVQRLAAI